MIWYPSFADSTSESQCKTLEGGFFIIKVAVDTENSQKTDVSKLAVREGSMFQHSRIPMISDPSQKQGELRYLAAHTPEYSKLRTKDGANVT